MGHNQKSLTPWVVTLYGLQLKVYKEKKLMVGLIDKGHVIVIKHMLHVIVPQTQISTHSFKIFPSGQRNYSDSSFGKKKKKRQFSVALEL